MLYVWSHSLEGVYGCHVTSGCHGNFSLLLNWKIITLAKIPHNLSVLKLQMPGASPRTGVLVLVERDRDGNRRESGTEGKCFCGFLNVIKPLFCYLTWVHPSSWYVICPPWYSDSPVRWDKGPRILITEMHRGAYLEWRSFRGIFA